MELLNKLKKGVCFKLFVGFVNVEFLVVISEFDFFFFCYVSIIIKRFFMVVKIVF